MADAGIESAYGASYADRIDRLYLKVPRKAVQLNVPTMTILSVEGSSAPGSDGFQQVIRCLYSVGYALRMDLKNSSLSPPPGYFEYKVGALEALWWNSEEGFGTNEPASLRWKLLLMVPDFVDQKLLSEVKRLVSKKHAELDVNAVQLETRAGEPAIQMLHVGPYREESPTIAALADYAKLHDLEMPGPHHEIYISDPGRTKPERLKTVIRYAIRPAPRS